MPVISYIWRYCKNLKCVGPVVNSVNRIPETVSQFPIPIRSRHKTICHIKSFVNLCVRPELNKQISKNLWRNFMNIKESQRDGDTRYS